jgi:histidinol-phosphate/aromatic aminotransferase/cobyric acid decarboxylase-like protein
MNGYGLPRHVRISIGLKGENHRMIAALERTLQR